MVASDPTLKPAGNISDLRTIGLDSVLTALQNANEKWLGYKYIIAGTSLDRAALALPAIGVSEIVFPEQRPVLTQVPSLDSEELYTISQYTYTEMTIRAPVTRDASLQALADRQRQALRGGTYEGFDIVIALNSHGSIDFAKAAGTDDTAANIGRVASAVNALVPISVYFALGCQVTNFKVATADANNASSMPLDELTLRVTDFFRPTL